MANYPTPHIDAKPGDFGQTVLMPGDPLRAKFIAENFLQDAVLVNNVRGIQGYTGTYGGTKISVMASGMGMPSIGIYSWELYTVFGVENIMRIGSTGALQDSIKLRDIVIGQGACTDSNWASQYHLAGTFAPIADFSLLEAAVSAARTLKKPFHVGNLCSSDHFYTENDPLPKWAKMGVLAVEMESAALYCNAAEAGKKALCITTISDCPLRNESTSAEERQTAFTDMMELALQTAVSVQK